MSEILAVVESASTLGAYWIILDCGHWYKWSGDQMPPEPGTELSCPGCRSVKRVEPGGGAGV